MASSTDFSSLQCLADRVANKTHMPFLRELALRCIYIAVAEMIGSQVFDGKPDSGAPGLAQCGADGHGVVQLELAARARIVAENLANDTDSDDAADWMRDGMSVDEREWTANQAVGIYDVASPYVWQVFATALRRRIDDMLAVD